jgi:hypothetical protein
VRTNYLQVGTLVCAFPIEHGDNKFLGDRKAMNVAVGGRPADLLVEGFRFERGDQ